MKSPLTGSLVKHFRSFSVYQNITDEKKVPEIYNYIPILPSKVLSKTYRLIFCPTEILSAFLIWGFFASSSDSVILFLAAILPRESPDLTA